MELSTSPDGPDLDETPQPARRVAGAFRRGLHTGLGLGGVVLVIATFLPLLHPLWPLASVAEHFAVQVLMGALALGALALLLRRWRWLSVVVAVALIQIWTIHPYWPKPTVPVTPVADQAARTMKVISLNVHHSGRSFEAVRQYLRDSDADVIGLVEMSRRWKMELASLESVYPFRIDCIDVVERCEEMLLSKHPFQQQGAGRIHDDLPVLVWAEIMPPGGSEPVTFAVSHVAWPLQVADPPEAPAANAGLRSLPSGLPRLVQAEQVATLTEAVNGLEVNSQGVNSLGVNSLGRNLVLMGDFNAAPWSRTQQYLRQNGAFNNHADLALTWPAWGPSFIRLPIDHIMTRGTPQLLSFEPGPNVGSDHLPVEALVALSAR
ncbi:MAG: endonuclease/exonuclease/phosphatase family protein [Rhodospirillaceae bacterium]|nr:endonuclease/exonuclease/phosphatase family protein [Rhodospirillaceae bacterium]